MAELRKTESERRAAVYGLRHSTARNLYDCAECGHLILEGEAYWRRFGKMGEAMSAWTCRTCEGCEAAWQRKYGKTEAS